MCSKDLLATAYWALIANMMSEMAHAVHNEADAAKYKLIVQNIRAAFQKAYIKDDGTVGTGTQTSYVVALYTKMAPEALEAKLVDNLVAQRVSAGHEPIAVRGDRPALADYVGELFEDRGL